VRDGRVLLLRNEREETGPILDTGRYYLNAADCARIG
jgi:hypothetical protein